MRSFRLLGPLLRSAQLSPLRSGPVRMGTARSLLCDGVLHLPAEGQSVLPAGLDATPLLPKRLLPHGAAPRHAAADPRLCHVSPTAADGSERARFALLLSLRARFGSEPAGIAEPAG
jgi:hypothetical protein